MPLKCLRVPLECILCARQGAHMAPGQVSDQCQILLGANLANLGPYLFGRTLWKRGVQYATKHMRISCWGPVWDRFRSTFNSAGQVPRAFSVRGTFSRRWCALKEPAGMEKDCTVKLVRLPISLIQPRLITPPPVRTRMYANVRLKSGP